MIYTPKSPLCCSLNWHGLVVLTWISVKLSWVSISYGVAAFELLSLGIRPFWLTECKANSCIYSFFCSENHNPKGSTLYWDFTSGLHYLQITMTNRKRNTRLSRSPSELSQHAKQCKATTPIKHINFYTLLKAYNCPAPAHILPTLVVINSNGYSLINSGISINSMKILF